MYLSRIYPNPRHKQARIDLANPYQLHATLCRAFAPPDQRPPRFLWRLEEGKTPQILVQSAQEPNWKAIQELFPGYLAQMPESKQLPLENLQPGQVLRFRLRANPTVTRKDPQNPEKRKRHGLKDVGEQLEWLHRQGAKGGFAVLGAMVVQSGRVRMYKHGGEHPIVIQAVLFEGYLKITDLDTFRKTLIAGLGHAKALGCGLLSIAKPRG
ncbi:type I-E CRISPR-associated protein Cas6/Cse3/CasE [Meiothermus rufus]|uniref:type I-E CRISPR-associated protein Cas6/Cse3/CasE n=1 Tax=Meiothermus rufus TaxID=604332 RepID=UPI000424758E|nr:type I-E CRISPR-associated protein Cas6/Cse3/CasE [Meiothermus rufus]